MTARYDCIGHRYAERRRPDPRIAARIGAALGPARTVINVGAGSGSYEPTDRHVIAVEPSRVMAAQRAPRLPPAIIAAAEDLPFADASADAVMAILTVHHWSDVAIGLAECTRIARERVVVLTVDPEVEAEMWLLADYLPDVAARDRQEFPSVERLTALLGGETSAEAVPVPRDCADGFLLSFWSTPERVLDPAARAATSAFARLDDAREAKVVARVADDLASGAWDARHGALRQLDAYDAGLGRITARRRPPAPPAARSADPPPPR